MNEVLVVAGSFLAGVIATAGLLPYCSKTPIGLACHDLYMAREVLETACAAAPVDAGAMALVRVDVLWRLRFRVTHALHHLGRYEA